MASVTHTQLYLPMHDTRKGTSNPLDSAVTGGPVLTLSESILTRFRERGLGVASSSYFDAKMNPCQIHRNRISQIPPSVSARTAATPAPSNRQKVQSFCAVSARLPIRP